MVQTFDPDVQAALEAAGTDGLILRYLIHLEGRNRDTDEIEELNLWTGETNRSLQVENKRTGAIVSRDYTAAHGWLKLPSIPQKLELEARSLRLGVTRLPQEMIDMIRVYDPKLRRVDMHRMIFNKVTRQPIAPATCIFLGFMNSAPINVPEAGGEGEIELEFSMNSRYLTRTRGDKFSDEFMKRRENDRFGKYLDVAGLWRVFWGEEEDRAGKGKKHRKEHFS
jgi:hypothetical protein